MVFIIIGFTFLSSCENKGKDDSSMSSDYQLIWSDEYQDENNNITKETVKGAKLFYEGNYTSLDTNISKRKDSKKEFYTNNYPL